MLVRLRCRFEMMSTSRFYFSFRHEKQHTAAEVVVMLFFFFVWKAVYRQALLSLPQVVEKVHFYKTQQILYPYKNALWALRPAKPLGVLSRHPCRNPKPLPRGEGLCMLCWLCIVQSLWAYTPGVRAGAECGAAALTPLGATPQTPFLTTIEVF